MSIALFLALQSGAASAEQIVLRNDTAYDDTFNTRDTVAWLEFPECAISVLTPDADDLPLTIDTIQFYLGSSQGNQDGQESLAILGVQQLSDSETPSGPGDWVWGEEAFTVTVTSTQLNTLNLDSPGEGLYPINLSEGRLAVWICPPDPATGESWPSSGATDTSGIVIDTDSPSSGNYLLYDGSVVSLASMGASGSWIIRAISGFTGGGSDGSGSGGAGTGGGGAGGSGGAGTGGSDGEPDALVVDSVTPTSAPYGVSADIVVLGSGFEAPVSASIGGLALGAVEAQGTTAFSARTPSALPIGIHDLVVTTASGEQDTLIEAFTVTGADTGEPVEEQGCACSGVAAAGGVWLALAALPLVLVRRQA